MRLAAQPQTLIIGWMIFHIHKQEKVLELQNAENGLLSADLLQAIEIANHGLIINTLGDYYAVLS
jgi:hypothetical protein